MKLDRLTRLFLFTIAAMVLQWLDSDIALPGAVPSGLGLYLTVVTFAVFVCSVGEGAVLTLLWAVLRAVILDGFDGFLIFGAGGLLAFFTIAGLKAVLKENQVWIAVCMATLAYGLGHLLTLMWVDHSLAWLLLAPMTMVYSVFSGLFMGLATQFVIRKGKNLWTTIFK